jgi:GT2 family glycosyltransferase
MSGNSASPLVSIIILNYNCGKYIERCLDAVKTILYPNLEVVVVDNASSDGSVALVKEKYPSFELIESPKNVGFAAGNNLGIVKAKGDYLLLLNPDTEIDSSCVRNLVKVLNDDDQIDVCGAKILLLDNKKVLQHAGGEYSLIGISIDRGMCEFDKGQYDRVEEVTFVCGAAMMFRRTIISEIGLLDPTFFVYHEDVDFCIRTWFHGGKVVYVPTAVVYHKSGYLTDLARRQNTPIIVFHKHKNTFLILLKNFSDPTILVWFPISTLYRMFWVVSFLSRNDYKSAIAVLRSILWVFQNSGRIMKDRRKTLRLQTVNECELKKLFGVTGDAWNAYRKLSTL